MFKLVYILLFFPIFISSQSFNFKGRVFIDKANNANNAILSFHINDSIVYSTNTDDNGFFNILLNKNTYDLSISKDEYFYEQKIVIDKNIEMNIMLKSKNEEVLDAVQVIGSKPIYKMEMDKKVYDLSQDIAAKGNSLAEVLNSVPMVAMDVDGALTIRGNANIKILIDGKPSGMAGISNNEALRSLSSDLVEKIEVITNPSSVYEADGSGGIINIILKKGKKSGINGNFETIIGSPLNFGLNVNVNNKLKSWNWFFNTSVNYSKPKGNTNIYLENYESNNIINSYSENNSYRLRNQLSNSTNFGFGFNLFKNTSLNSSFGYRLSNEKNSVSINYFDFNNLYNLIDTSFRGQNDIKTNENISANVSIVQKFLKDGHKLSFDFSFEKNIENENSNVEEFNTFNTETLTQRDRYKNNQNQNRINAQIDYILPINNAKIEMGIRNNYQRLLTDFEVESQDISTNLWNYNDLFTDDTEYKENISAAYAQYSNTVNKFSFQIGLRTELSDINILSSINKISINKKYTDLYPSAFLTYSFNDNNQIQINYSRRIQRPRGRFLIPFVTFSDDRNTFRGNPDINPFYTHSYELNYITKIGKLNITPALFYRDNKGIWEVYVSKQIMNIGDVEQEIFVAMPINVGNQEQYGGSLIYNINPYKWLKLLGEFNIFAYNQKGEFDGKTFNGRGTSYSGRLNTTFKLPYDIDIQIQNNYNGPNQSEQGKRYSMYFMNLGISKDLFKGNASISFNVQDLFNSNKRKIQTFGDTFQRIVQFQPRERQINLIFTYRLNQKNTEKKERKSQEGGIDIGF